MAIINSIVLGSSRGKIGNIVTTSIHGQQIAKQKREKGSIKSSPLQITKQQKLTNTYQAYNYLSVGKAGFKKYMLAKENYYNFFVRAFNQYFPSGLRLPSSVACNYLIDKEFGYSGVFSCTSVSLNQSIARVYFICNRQYLQANSTLLLQVWKTDFEGTRVVERKITTQEAINGYMDFNVINDFWSGAMCYLYTKNHKFTSGISFFAIG